MYVIASDSVAIPDKQSCSASRGLPRRYAPRNDDMFIYFQTAYLALQNKLGAQEVRIIIVHNFI
jgi:hypothetical protein